MKKVNIGVIGVGRIGRIHATNLKNNIPGANLLAVSDVYEKGVKEVAENLEVPIAVTDYQRLLENKDIDAVVICSSTDTHARIISEAAEASKHIFCEKPIALEIEKIDRALAAVDKAGVTLQVGFNRRFDPSFRKAREKVASGAIGEPHLVRITSRDPEPPSIDYVKVSGGLFLDMMIHDFDMARYIIGDEIEELMATGTCLIDPAIAEAGDVDTAVVTLKYRGGALGTIDNSRKAVYGYDQRIEVFGSEGCVIVGNHKPTEVTMLGADNVNSDKPLFFFLERYQEAYREEMKEFVAVVKGDKEPLVSGIDGKISVQLGYAAQESIKKGCYIKIQR